MEKIAQATRLSIAELVGNSRVLGGLNPKDFADDTFGIPTVSDIIAELDKPGRDPRPEFKTATFKEGVEKISDLTPGMVLEGTVTNVAAFGAFVDVGVHQDGLVHISAMSNSYVSDPHEVVRSGEVVKVKVLEVDVARKRISLTLRLDDDANADKSSAPKKSSAPRKKQPQSKNPRGKQQSAPRGSMADALKNAGF